MEDNYVPISMLNDFVFCPYSIYLHNVYMEASDEVYHARPQVTGKISHGSIDNKKYDTSKNTLMSLPVSSNVLRVYGAIDIYRQDEKLLIERKYKLPRIYRGQLYQLWAQYVCLKEMGFAVENIAFYEMSTNKKIPVDIPSQDELLELTDAVERFRHFEPSGKFVCNPSKCLKCIYVNLCDKTDVLNNVYT